MNVYRCYLLDAQDHIRAVENIEAHGLNQAKEQALVMLRQHLGHRSIQIWQGRRRLYPVSSLGLRGEQPGAEHR